MVKIERFKYTQENTGENPNNTEEVGKKNGRESRGMNYDEIFYEKANEKRKQTYINVRSWQSKFIGISNT